MKATPILTSFNGGELSPLLAGRTDIAKYATGCKVMEGFLPLTQGPAIACPGFKFVAEVKSSAQRTWFIRFEFSEDDAYMLEVGHLYMRFYANRAQVVTGPSTPYEIVTPYASADLTNADGTFALRFVGTGDEIYIVHPKYFPQLLARHGATNWTIGAVSFSPPPFAQENSTATTVYASAATGAVNLVASAAVFTAADIGTFFYLGERDVRDVQQWEPAKAITVGAVRRSNGLNYQAINSATTGSIRPTHTEGAAYDGDGGVQWQFLDAGYGWVMVTAVADSTHASGTVSSRLPSGAVGAGEATARWAHQAWNSVDGYPTEVAFFRERLCFARDATIWFSVAGDFPNFSYQQAGAVVADSAFERTLASALANKIKWMSPGEVLLVGTAGDEWAVVETNEGDAFGPANCRTKRQSAYGSNNVAPEQVGTETVFIQKSGRKARAMAFRFEDNGFASPDVTVYAEHVTRTKIVAMAFQQEPWGFLWAVRGDGVLAGMMLNREQDGVAWFRRPLAGAVVEAVSCIPSPSGERDDVWIIARYTINGVTRRYIAYLSDEDTDETDKADWVYSDMAATYRGAPATHITGLGYLRGQTVWVLVDGATHPDRVVAADGSIDLQVPGSVVTVGLPSPATLWPMNPGGGNGSGQGKVERAHAVTFRLNRTPNGLVGPDADNLQQLRDRFPATPMGSGPDAFTGDVEMDWNGDYLKSLPLVVMKTRPTPLTVCAIMPQLTVSEGR